MRERKSGKERMLCFYCKKKGHIVATCPVLKKQNLKPVALVNKIEKVEEIPESSDLGDFKPFVMDGFVSMPGCRDKVPVKMLRDTTASQSFILEGVLPFSDKSAVGSDVPILGFNVKGIGVPLHKVYVESDGEVTVLAGGKVLVTPEVTPVPVRHSPDYLAVKFPKVFAACAVTPSCSKKGEDLNDSFICYPPVDSQGRPETVEKGNVDEGLSLKAQRLSLSRDQLIIEQKNDATLSRLFKAVVAGDEVDSLSTCYFMKDGLLMRKWTQLTSSLSDYWSVVTQAVIPVPYCATILNVAHDNPFSGHLGIKKQTKKCMTGF